MTKISIDEMKNKILLLSGLLMLLLALCLSTFIGLSTLGHLTLEILWRNFIYNLPPFIFLGMIDFWLINTISRKVKDEAAQIVAIVVAMLLPPLILSGAVFLLSSYFDINYSFEKNILPTSLCNCIITLVVCVYLYGLREIESARRLADIESEKVKYQFEALKNQVNPHFLFNSLNVLASLAYQDARKTNLFAKRLAEIYRYVLLTHDRNTVSVAEELRFIEAYIYLEKIRFGDALQVRIENDGTHNSCDIIPVSLQTLVENAIKHNSATIESPLNILISVGHDGVTVTNNLQLRNNLGNNGIGLRNLRQQYSMHDKDIEIVKSTQEYIVVLPYISE